jgi:hypothetical protein
MLAACFQVSLLIFKTFRPSFHSFNYLSTQEIDWIFGNMNEKSGCCSFATHECQHLYSQKAGI